jgi:hypothetical protein
MKETKKEGKREINKQIMRGRENVRKKYKKKI